MFSNVEITPKFSVNHNKSQKLYFEPQHFTQQKNISYKETFDKILFESKVLHPNTGETVGIVFITQFEEPKRAIKSTKFVLF